MPYRRRTGAEISEYMDYISVIFVSNLLSPQAKRSVKNG